MKRLFFVLLLLWVGVAGAQDKRSATAAECPKGDPWTLAPKGRQHIVQNEQKPVRVRICYCEGGSKGDTINVVTIDDRTPDKPIVPKPVPKDSKGAKGAAKPLGTNWRVLGFGSCGDYAGQEIYVHNPKDFHVSGTYLIRGDK